MEAAFGVFAKISLFFVFLFFLNIPYNWESGNAVQRFIYRSSKIASVIISWPLAVILAPIAIIAWIFERLIKFIELAVPVIWLLIKWGVVLGVGAYGLIAAPIPFLLIVIAMILFEILKRMK